MGKLKRKIHSTQGLLLDNEMNKEKNDNNNDDVVVKLDQNANDTVIFSVSTENNFDNYSVSKSNSISIEHEKVLETNKKLKENINNLVMRLKAKDDVIQELNQSNSFIYAK